jgi:hypothetical protein
VGLANNPACGRCQDKKKWPYVSYVLDELGNYHLGTHIMKVSDYYKAPLGNGMHFIHVTGLLSANS